MKWEVQVRTSKACLIHDRRISFTFEADGRSAALDAAEDFLGSVFICGLIDWAGIREANTDKLFDPIRSLTDIEALMFDDDAE